VLHTGTILKVKSDCPKCGGKKKLTTKVDLVEGIYSGVKCHKCGYRAHGGYLDMGAIKVHFTHPTSLPG